MTKTVTMHNLYYDYESENVLEELNGKWRILDEYNNFKPYTRFQKMKVNDGGCDYLVLNGEEIELGNDFEEITEAELSKYSK